MKIRKMVKVYLLILMAVGAAPAVSAAMPKQKGEEQPMQEQKGKITMKGNPLTLVGEPVEVGREAPDCTLIGNDLSPVKLSSYRGKVCLISVVPSLDTGVCDTQTRRFNEEAGRLGDDVVVLTISVDLPFAQARWCGAAGVDHVVTLSDYQENEFGKAYGLLIKELKLLARAVLVVDKEGKVRYFQLVPEVATEPDYDKAVEAAKNVL